MGGEDAQEKGENAEDCRCGHGQSLAVARGDHRGWHVADQGPDARQGHDQAGGGYRRVEIPGAECDDRQDRAVRDPLEHGRSEGRQGNLFQAEGSVADLVVHLR